MWLESAPGQGKRVLVVLPEVDRDVPATMAAPSVRGQTILLVEDDEAVRSMAAHILRRHGYEVVGAAGAEQAC